MQVYIPILVLFVIAFGFAAFSVTMGSLAGPKRWNKAKLDAYECGIEPTPIPLGGGKVPVKFYLTAMLFIVFDIEIIFLYPWAVAFDRLGAFGRAGEPGRCGAGLGPRGQCAGLDRESDTASGRQRDLHGALHSARRAGSLRA